MTETAVRVNSFDERDESKMCYWFHPAERSWYLWIPGCGLANLRRHKVVENPDDTITVTPSILTVGTDSGQRVRRHGYLTNSVWIEC